MTLATSGTISIGGSTANRSINIELDRSATATSSLGETALRTLAGVSSGAISLSNFYDKSHILDTQTVTVGYKPGAYLSPAYYGYRASDSVGSIADGTFNVKSGAVIQTLRALDLGGIGHKIIFIIAGQHSNSGFDTMTIGSTEYSRSAASFSSSSTSTQWTWNRSTDYTVSPLGSSAGATKTVTWQ